MGSGDIRKVGSGNVGATNAIRAAGPLAGALVVIGDVGKGVVAVLIVGFMPETYFQPEYLKMAAGFAAVVGHIFPIYLGFKGGKGVNTALGVMLTLLTIPALIGLATFILTVSITRYVSLGSMLGSIALFGAVLIGRAGGFTETPIAYLIMSGVLMLLIIIAHRSNIGRLFKGSENKLSLSQKKEETQNA